VDASLATDALDLQFTARGIPEQMKTQFSDLGRTWAAKGWELETEDFHLSRF
jgi:hypothetical protein